MPSSAERNPSASSLADRYRVLLDVGRILTGTLGIDDLFRTIYRETSRVLEAGGFYISLYDEERDLATVVFYADRGREQESEITYRGSESDVIRTGEPSMVTDRTEVDSLLVLRGPDEAPDEEVTRSAISAPLRYKGRVMGAISAQSYEPESYGPEDVELLQGIADLAAVAIENARYVSEVERRRRESERVEEIGRAIARSLEGDEVLQKVIDAVLELLSADGAAVWLIDREGVAEVAYSQGPVRVPEGLTWEMEPEMLSALTGDPGYVVVDDLAKVELPPAVREHLAGGTGLGAPLIVEELVVGVLTAGSRRTQAFSQDDVHMLTRLAAQASVAMENARLHSDLQSLSLTDPLTGLPNRRHLAVHLERQLAAARRGRSLATVIFDLDNFKHVNDTLGHTEGDRILQRVGGILEREARSMNLVARYGGDEFISVLAETDAPGARAHADRIARSVAEDEALSAHGITLSYGIAVFDPRMEGAEELVKAADEDLYRAKGRRLARNEMDEA